MKAYKGFKPNADGTLQCRDKVYLAGETYTEPEAELCRTGMHACLEPLDVLTYYPPASSVYHQVEVGDDAQPSESGDSKVATTTLTVGAELGVPELVAAQVEYTVSRAKPSRGSHSTGDRGAASATGYRGAAAATGDEGAASATGYRGAAAATGVQGVASATGPHSIAHADGLESSAKGALGCALTLAERNEKGELLEIAAVIVGREYDGQTIEPGVYYRLVDGKVEVAE